MSRKRNFSTPFTWSFQSMEKHGSVMSLCIFDWGQLPRCPHPPAEFDRSFTGTATRHNSTRSSNMHRDMRNIKILWRGQSDCTAVYLPHSHPWRPSSPPGIHNPQICKYRATQKLKREASLQQAVWPQFRPPSFQGTAFFRQALAKLLPNFRKKSLYRL